MQRTLPVWDNPNCIHTETSLAIKKRLCQQGVTSWIRGIGTGMTRIQVAGCRQGSLTVSMWREGVFVSDQSDCKQVSGVVLMGMANCLRGAEVR